MNLVTRFLAARRDKLLMRLGCWLVCFSLVLGLMLPQQRAEALVAELTITAVASVAAAYLGACGLPFITKGMDKDALVSSVQRLLQEFLDLQQIYNSGLPLSYQLQRHHHYIACKQGY